VSGDRKQIAAAFDWQKKWAVPDLSAHKARDRQVARNLNREGFAAAVITRPVQSQRTAALPVFNREAIRILVATEVAARGIHLQDIAHVTNYDCQEISGETSFTAWAAEKADGQERSCFPLYGREQRSDCFGSSAPMAFA